MNYVRMVWSLPPKRGIVSREGEEAISLKRNRLGVFLSLDDEKKPAMAR